MDSSAVAPSPAAPQVVLPGWVKVKAVADDIKSQLFELDESVDAVVLAVLSRSHVCFIGAPGGAKSLIVSEVAKRVKGALYFNRLVGKTTVPDELFGPYRLSSLKRDVLERNTSGKLPEAELAFIDEIFKASSAILNALLRVMNERLFENDGQIQACPLVTMFGASNELPQEDCLGALWDRFLVRRVVEYAREESSFAGMLSNRAAGKRGQVNATIDRAELLAAQAEVVTVGLPHPTIAKLIEVKNALTKDGVIASPRRWSDSVPLLQARAWLSGRTKVDLDDLMVLTDVLWTELDHIPKVRKVLTDLIQPDRQQILDTHAAAVTAWTEFQALDPATRVAKAGEYGPKLKKSGEQIKRSLEKLKAAGREPGDLEHKLNELRGWHKQLVNLIAGEM